MLVVYIVHPCLYTWSMPGCYGVHINKYVSNNIYIQYTHLHVVGLSYRRLEVVVVELNYRRLEVVVVGLRLEMVVVRVRLEMVVVGVSCRTLEVVVVELSCRILEVVEGCGRHCNGKCCGC